MLHHTGRYKHAVKSELISFCYASTDAAGDAGLVAETNRSPEFVRTLMNIVEKDKEIADLAVNLVEEIDLMEKAKVTTAAASRGNEPEDPLFKAIWENHEKSRKQVAKFLEEERFDIYGEKDIGKQVNLPSATDDEDDEDEPPVWARTNFDKWIRKPTVAQTKPTLEKVTPTEQPSNGTGALSDAELREQEITAGMQNLLDRLGCADSVPADATYEQKLAIIQERLRNLKEQVHELRQTSSAPLTATAAESTTAVTGSSSE